MRRLLQTTLQPVGRNGAPPSLADSFLQGYLHVSRALRQANARAWLAVEVLLAGENLWERAQLTWERSLEMDFYKPLRLLLDDIPLTSLDEKGPDRRRKSGRALQAALANGLLTSGPLELAELLAEINREDGEQKLAE
jgi:hypothetical protein